MPVTTKAYDHYVTALHSDAFDFLLDLIDAKKITTFLELGTGYGETSNKLHQRYPDLKITTLEKKPAVYNEASKRFENTSIKVIHVDAMAYHPDQTFDLILVDASKSKQQKLVEKYIPFLTPKGMMLVDNIHISRLKKEPMTRSRRALIKKHEAFIDYLKNQKALITDFHVIGDGIALIKKNSEIAPKKP